MSVGWPQTFSLDLDQAQKALTLYAHEPGASIQTVSSQLGIGGPKVEGLNAWLKYLGLRDPKTRKLTPLGNLLYRRDPSLADRGTHCVLHYHLVSNPEATVWYETVNHFLAQRSSFTRNDLQSYFQESGIGQNSPKQLKSDFRLLINTYADNSRRAFNDLGFFTLQEDAIIVRPIVDVHPFILGYCLFHRLESGLRESTTSIKRLLEEDGRPGLVFRFHEDDLREKLSTLESAGYISVVRIADINGISYAVNEPALDCLEHYFENTL